MTYTKLTNALIELLETEHCNDCDQLTCDISQSHSHGYGLWSLYLFDSCGAASDEFQDLYHELTTKHWKRFKRDSERERALFVESVAQSQCPHCNAVSWHDGETDPDGTVHCDSCGKNYSPADGAK